MKVLDLNALESASGGIAYDQYGNPIYTDDPNTLLALARATMPTSTASLATYSNVDVADVAAQAQAEYSMARAGQYTAHTADQSLALYNAAVDTLAQRGVALDTNATTQAAQQIALNATGTGGLGLSNAYVGGGLTTADLAGLNGLNLNGLNVNGLNLNGLNLNGLNLNGLNNAYVANGFYGDQDLGYYV